MVEVLVEFLAPRSLLLLLDNCEQVVDGVAKLSETLLRAAPRLRILATSREPIGIGGEAILRVPPLAVPGPDRQPTLRGLPRYDAVTLFTERATSAVSTFQLTDDNRTAVATICRQLDGLPLPIELAAAQLRALSPEQILNRLADRYALLTHGSRVAPSRQQTLQLCIDWSYDLCTVQERLVWSRLSVFAGSAQSEAAEQVCGGGLTAHEMLDALFSLVDKSILIREESEGIVRFRLLETLRDYGRQKCQQDDEYPDLRRKHRDWYRQLALEAEAGWISSRQLAWIARLSREQPNLREAMEFCVSDSPNSGLSIATALYPFWSATAQYSEGRRWLDRLLARESGEPTIERIKALCASSIMAEVQGDLEMGAAQLEQAHALTEQIAGPLTHALVAHADGMLALFGGDLHGARSHLERCTELLDSRDTLRQIGVLQALGMTYEQLVS